MALGWTIAICVIVGLLLGYFIGHVQHRGKGKTAEEAVKAHDEYRDEVHEHFQQTSQIMSRMVDDYREMYQHLSAGAGKLANIHPERVVTPPPAPEAITAQDADDDARSEAAKPAASTDEDKGKDSAAAEQDDDKAAAAEAAAETSADNTEDAAAGRPRVDEDEKARARRLSGNAV